MDAPRNDSMAVFADMIWLAGVWAGPTSCVYNCMCTIYLDVRAIGVFPVVALRRIFQVTSIDPADVICGESTPDDARAEFSPLHSSRLPSR